MPITIKINPIILNWSHFKVVDKIPDDPDADAKVSAFFGFDSYNFTKGSKAKITDLNIKVYLNPKDTLVKKTSKKGPTLLKHEQGHYDITVLCARALKRDLELIPAQPDVSLTATIDKIMTLHKTRCQEINYAYDTLTDHSQTLAAQKMWDNWIGKALKETHPTKVGNMEL
jgi:hypothetical protein